jgi:Tol biopolymer transport system component
MVMGRSARRYLLPAFACCMLWAASLPAQEGAELISIGYDGQAADGIYALSEIRSEAVSAEGRWVVFSSTASNLVDPLDNCNPTSWNIYLRDRDADTTQMLTCIPGGFSGSAVEGEAAITPDGETVAFRSTNANLVPDDHNGSADIFIVTAGGLERVSVASDGTEGIGCPCSWPDYCYCEPDNYCSHPSISADGRYVVFASYAQEFFEGDLQGTLDVFLHDREQATTRVISIAPDGGIANGDSWEPAISADGAYVAFTSKADNLGVADSNGQPDVYLWNRETGVMQRVSVASDGSEANGFSGEAEIDAEGRRVVFASGATNLATPDVNGYLTDAFVHDLDSGTTLMLSAGMDSGGRRPAISDDGRMASFTSGRDDVYLVDLEASGQAKLAVGYMQYSALSTEAKALVVSGYNSLVPEDTNSAKDVYLLPLEALDEPAYEDEICDDGIDNDGDGLSDCSDRDCRRDPVCGTSGGGRDR